MPSLIAKWWDAELRILTENSAEQRISTPFDDPHVVNRLINGFFVIFMWYGVTERNTELVTTRVGRTIEEQFESDLTISPGGGGT